jgi:hypothetical protein
MCLVFDTDRFSFSGVAPGYVPSDQSNDNLVTKRTAASLAREAALQERVRGVQASRGSSSTSRKFLHVGGDSSLKSSKAVPPTQVTPVRTCFRFFRQLCVSMKISGRWGRPGAGRPSPNQTDRHYLVPTVLLVKTAHSSVFRAIRFGHTFCRCRKRFRETFIIVGVWPDKEGTL